MRLLPLRSQEVRTIRSLKEGSIRSSVDRDGIHVYAETDKVDVDRVRTWLHVCIRFEWRDIWFGVYKGKDATYICLVPMFPIILKVKAS